MTDQLIDGALYKLNKTRYDWVYSTKELLLYNLYKYTQKISDEKTIDVILYLGQEISDGYNCSRFLYCNKIVKFKNDYYLNIFLEHWEVV